MQQAVLNNSALHLVLLNRPGVVGPAPAADIPAHDNDAVFPMTAAIRAKLEQNSIRSLTAWAAEKSGLTESQIEAALLEAVVAASFADACKYSYREAVEWLLHFEACSAKFN